MTQEYTHKELIAAGYVRYGPDEHGQPGFFGYRRPREEVWFIGNSAMMNDWIENYSNWKKNFPELYKWWNDPTRQTIDQVEAFRGTLHMIKGEDPMLKEGQDGS